MVQFLVYITPKFQASSSFLCLYRSVCVGPVRKPHCWFSHEAAHILYRCVFVISKHLVCCLDCIQYQKSCFLFICLFLTNESIVLCLRVFGKQSRQTKTPLIMFINDLDPTNKNHCCYSASNLLYRKKCNILYCSFKIINILTKWLVC